MSLFRTLSIAFEDMVVGIEGSFADMASMMIDPFQKLLSAHTTEHHDDEFETGTNSTSDLEDENVSDHEDAR